MKIGIYGGTFNPPHLGHLAAAQGAVEKLGLDKLLLIPAATPPHKALPEGTAPQQCRLAMTRLMAEGINRSDVVEVSTMEMDRQGESYTVDTLRTLQKEHPNAQLYLLVGTDMFQTFHQWREPKKMLKLATLVAFGRAKGDDLDFAKQRKNLEKNYGGTVKILTLPNLVEVSSTQLRDQLGSGQGGELLPPAVYGYILRQNLYHARENMTGLDENSLRRCSHALVRSKRILHILGTEETAAQLAQHWGCDEVSARRAAILHDCTKYWSPEEHLEICHQFDFHLDEMERTTPKLLHAKSGACMARHLFGETEAVVDAISYHTTGRREMSLLEKIIYMADYMEPNRDFDGVEQLRQLAFSNLDEAVRLGIEMTIEDMESYHSPIHPNTLEAGDWLRD